jgi:Flp pilus assembly protein TadD
MMIWCRHLICFIASAVVVAGCAHGPREDVAGAQRELARELVQQRDWQRGFAMADALCRSAPRDPEGFLLRGIVYREQRLFTESEGDLKEALRLDSRSARAHSALAILYDLQSRSEDAVDHHRRAAELGPGDPRYLNNLGFSLFARGSTRDAVEVLQQAVRASPADSRIRNNLGFAYAGAGDLTRAAEQFAFGGSPAEAKNNLGWAYERRGALPQAFELYVEALRLDPGATAARKNLTRVARDLGREPPAELASPPDA